jgi:hypothetical protein
MAGMISGTTNVLKFGVMCWYCFAVRRFPGIHSNSLTCHASDPRRRLVSPSFVLARTLIVVEGSQWV